MSYKLLDIDLSSRNYKSEDISDEVIGKYIGGRGLGAYLLYNSTKKGMNPLSPDSPLILSAGLAQGLPTPFSPKLALNTKSPLTGIYLFSITSGEIGPNLRRSGYVSVRIKGASEEPLYILIHDNGVEFKGARHVWGKNTRESQEIIIKEVGGKNGDVAIIGPAGEKLSSLAGIFSAGNYLRCFGRGGGGAVMGSKGLKGIVIISEKKLEAPSPDKFKAIREKIINSVKKESEWATFRRNYGTGGDMDSMNELGIIPTRNWQGSVFPHVEKLCTTTQGWPRKNIACGPNCPAPCAHFIKIGKGPYKGAQCDGPEYETIYAFGTQCGVDRFDAIVAAGQICDEYGIDTMSAGMAIGFAMECFERGLINEKDTGGIQLRFGDDRAMIAMLNKLVKEEDLGKILARGVRYASEQIPGSSGFAMHAKGLDLGGYECRGSWGQALQSAVNARGGCHHGYGLPARFENAKGIGMVLEGKGQMVKNAATRRILFDSLIVCTMAQVNIFKDDIIAELLSALFGREWPWSEVEQVGERIQNMERLFNAREGLTRDDDRLPDRLTKEPKPDGPSKGQVVPLEALKDDYYRAMGWEISTGLPIEKRLKELGIEI